MAINFVISLKHDDGVITNPTPDYSFKIGKVISDVTAPQGSMSGYVNVREPEGTYYLNSIIESIAGANGAWGDWYNMFVGTTCNIHNQMGCKMRTQYDSSQHRYYVYIKDRVTSAHLFLYCTETQTKSLYLCVPWLGEASTLYNEEITSLSDLKTVLRNIWYPRYRDKEDDMWRIGIDNFKFAPLVGIIHDPTRVEGRTERPMYDIGYTYNTNKGFCANLSTLANWYHFLTNEFLYYTQYIDYYVGAETNARRIYLSSVVGYSTSRDHLFKDGSNYASYQMHYQELADVDTPPMYAIDFQSGTDILDLLSNHVGSTLRLNNGSTISITQKVDTASNPDRYYYYFQLRNPGEEEPIIMRAAFNAYQRVGDMAGSNLTDIPFKPLYIDGGTDDQLVLLHAGLLASPTITEGSASWNVEEYIARNATKPEEFWEKSYHQPITFAGVYKSAWDITSSTSNASQRKEKWKKNSSIQTLLCQNISGYRTNSYQDQTYNKLVNLFSYIDLPDEDCDISAFIDNNGGEVGITSAEGASFMWGLKETIDPNPPTGGGSSIGGGGASSSGSSGGGGNYNDAGHNIGFSMGNSFGSTDTLVNYFIGDLANTDNALSFNLNRLANWFKYPVSLSATDLSGLFYKYSDKVANVCSLKVIYSPDWPTMSSNWKYVKIHGQWVKGSDEVSVAPMQGKPITNQFKQEIIRLNLNIPEYFGSFLDYEPYTKVQIYLPFAGVHELNASDIIGKDVSLHANIDFLSGTIVYNIRCNTGSCNSILYTFTGNCAVDLPLTARDYGEVVAGLGRTLVSAGAAMVNPTAATAAAFGASAGLGALTTGGFNSYKSTTIGGYGGTSGALSPMQCYLIVNRPKKIEAEAYKSTYGYPSMQSVVLGRLTGYVKVADCNWGGIVGATEEELKEIDSLMKTEGAIL